MQIVTKRRQLLPKSISPLLLHYTLSSLHADEFRVDLCCLQDDLIYTPYHDADLVADWYQLCFSYPVNETLLTSTAFKVPLCAWLFLSEVSTAWCFGPVSPTTIWRRQGIL
jgi:hypothetical protein